MSVNIKQLNDKMTGLEFRSLINTNFTNLKEAVESIDTEILKEEITNSVKESISLNELGFSIANADDNLEGQPFGYINGTKYIAGVTVNSEVVHAVGWYIGGKSIKTGVLALDETLTAGATVYVLNGGGWTTEKPTSTGQLIQPIGTVSDDGMNINISVADVWGVI